MGMGEIQPDPRRVEAMNKAIAARRAVMGDRTDLVAQDRRRTDGQRSPASLPARTTAELLRTAPERFRP